MKIARSLVVAGFLAASLSLVSVPVYAKIPVGTLEGEVPSLAPMVEKAMPAVVNIAARAKIQPAHVPQQFSDPFSDPFFQQFFGGAPFGQVPLNQVPRQQAPVRETQAIGSGVIVDADNGYVLTNHHVVNNADEIYVILKDKRRIKATLVGSDPETDIAVLKVDADHLTAMPVGDSDKLRVGDYVAAIGSPFGLSHTVTSGIVSALGRTGLGIEGYEDFIQTDASINPGNSGGALMDLHGNLVGINTAIFSQSGGSMGIGFAIPINMAKSVMHQIITNGGVKRGKIGIAMQDITPDLAEALSLGNMDATLVNSVVPGSPAEKAGLKSGDVITSVNGQSVKSGAHLRNIVGLTEIGQSLSFGILRDGKPLNVMVTVGEIEKPEAVSAGGVDKLDGARFSDIPADHPLYGKVKGIFVAEIEYGSPAWRSGLQAGDIILSVNRKDVSGVDDLVKYAGEGDVLLMNVQRGNASVFIVVR